jgi:ribosomal protein RSM22 (predicted rRNA methylase)
LDHGTTEGFQSIVIARDYLLRKGKKQLATTQDDTVELLSETEDDISTKPASSTVGSHVVAPVSIAYVNDSVRPLIPFAIIKCPHDGPCPLSLPSALSTTSTASICHFSQRLSRPEYTRKTKHSNRGEEDMKYSYVVIRRGPRPLVSHPIEVAQAIPSPIVQRRLVESEASESEADDVVHLTWDESQSADLSTDQATIPLSERGLSRTDEDLRANSYHWPRIIYPPMKRSGHIILDTCTKEGRRMSAHSYSSCLTSPLQTGNIARHTIPKSQGKQAYYDARKSSWGDSFPWEGKNGPQIRKIAQAVASTKRPFKKQATQA